MTACPKPRPRLLDKRDKAADLKRIDLAESAKVKKRCSGRCEVRVRLYGEGRGFLHHECVRRAAPGNHHLIGGSGRRNKGKSILADHRLAVCQRCHDDITGNVLVPIGTPKQRESASQVIYQRRTV